jgi:hypothetical protein
MRPHGPICPSLPFCLSLLLQGVHRKAFVIPSAPSQPLFLQLPTPQFTRLLGFGAPTSKTQRLELEGLM